MSTDANSYVRSKSILGYLWLQPGLSRINGYTMLWGCLTGIPFLVVINFFQPYILTEMLGVPPEQQGSVSAYLAVLHEIVMILLVGPFGALADKFGRRRIYALGFVIAAAGLMIYPFAESVTELTLFRLVYSFGSASIVASYSTLLTDYPAESSRGKMVAMAGMLNGAGILILTALSGILPTWLEGMGYGPIITGRLSMAVLGSMCLGAGIVIAIGLIGGDKFSSKKDKMPFLKLMAKGIGAGKNPRIFVSFASAFAARGDVVVIGTYVTLWGTIVGKSIGMTGAEALAKATIIFVVIQTAALIAAPIIGIINDRINRVTALVLGMSLASFGYLVFGFSQNPFDDIWGIVAAVFLGIGQMSAILAGTTLIGQEVNPKITGATIGVWSFFGAVGTLGGSFFGGLLFDSWRPGAPFLLMGFANLLVAFMTIYVRVRWPQDEPLRMDKYNQEIAQDINQN
jgi:MFS family permease